MRSWLMSLAVIGSIAHAAPTGENSMPSLATIQTNLGSFTVELYDEAAPKAVENFVTLAQKGYYNGVTFHRVIKNFMIQGGDPTGTGAGGESCWGKNFADECTADVRFDQPGLLAMANRGPNTNGSQFFVTTVPCPWLNGRHTIFGKVTKGMDTVKKIEGSKVGPGDKPSAPVVIQSVTVDAPQKA
jgi:cyclophilin family peptidyl-prolyl cis-trans isomerase